MSAEKDKPVNEETPPKAKVERTGGTGTRKEEQAAESDVGGLARNSQVSVAGKRSYSWLALLPTATMAVCTLVIAVTNVTYVYYMSKQWQVMQGTLDETKNMVGLATQQANAAASSAKAAERSAASAEATLRAAGHALETSERAYVGVKAMEVGQFEENKKLTAAVVFENAGRTPAVNFTSYIYLLVRSRSLGSFPRLPAPKRMGTIGHIIPGGRSTGQASTDVPLSAELVRDIREGKAWVYFCGVAHYRDIFESVHKTEFCGVYLPRQHPEFGGCPFPTVSD